MAKVKPVGYIEKLSGKVCMHSDTYYRTNKVTNAIHTGKLCNPSEKAPSAEQTAVRSRFAKVSAAVRTRLEVAATKAEMQKEFHSQSKYGSLFGYAFHKWNDEYDQNGDLIGD